MWLPDTMPKPMPNEHAAAIAANAAAIAANAAALAASPPSGLLLPAAAFGSFNYLNAAAYGPPTPPPPPSLSPSAAAVSYTSALRNRLLANYAAAQNAAAAQNTAAATSGGGYPLTNCCPCSCAGGGGGYEMNNMNCGDARAMANMNGGCNGDYGYTPDDDGDNYGSLDGLYGSSGGYGSQPHTSAFGGGGGGGGGGGSNAKQPFYQVCAPQKTFVSK